MCVEFNVSIFGGVGLIESGWYMLNMFVIGGVEFVEVDIDSWFMSVSFVVFMLVLIGDSCFIVCFFIFFDYLVEWFDGYMEYGVLVVLFVDKCLI